MARAAQILDDLIDKVIFTSSIIMFPLSAPRKVTNIFSQPGCTNPVAEWQDWLLMSDEKVAPIIICDIGLLYNTDDRSSWVNHVIIIMSLLAVSLLQKIRFYARNLSRLHILLLKQTLFAITIQHNDAIVRARRHYTASLLAAATIQKRALLRIIIHFCSEI